MASFTRQIDDGLRGIRDQYVSARTPNWTADQNASSVSVATEEELFPGEWYGGKYNASFRFPNVTIPKGATITSAKITFINSGYGGAAKTVNAKIVGVAEDNTAEQTTSPIDDARTRSHTSAAIDWDYTHSFTYNNEPFDTADFSSVIQEITDRAGWSSGNALGIYIYDDGTPNNNGMQFQNYFMNGGVKDWSRAALLTITYEYGGSPSVSPSASASPSVSPSASASPSASVSVSVSPSISNSPSPSPAPPHFFGLKIAKPGVNVLKNSDPDKLIFSSEYGTLKYKTKQQVNITIDAGAGDISARGEYAHNLGKYLFAEVFVSSYIGSPTGLYEYCPFYGAGASVSYNATYTITPNKIIVYAEISGVSSSVWHFDFLIFVHNNDLKLS